MHSFNAARFEIIILERTKGPAEKRRLQRRLEERRRRKGLPPPVTKPAKPRTPTDTSITEKERQKEIKAARTQRRFRRKIKTRQRLAARSGLSELDRRSKWQAVRTAHLSAGLPEWEQVLRAHLRAGRAGSIKGVDGGVPAPCAGKPRAAEEFIEVSPDTRQKTPLYDNFFEDLPPWR